MFAQRGYVDASISDIADQADVAVTAVYYHFAGKDDLYEAAITNVLDQVDTVVRGIRADDAPATADTLHQVIDAVWEWVDENPVAATLMHLHTPAATRQTSRLRREFDDRHVRRAFAYLGEPLDITQASPARVGTATLAMRSLVDLLIAIHPMRMPGGPLSDCSPASLRSAVKSLSARLVGSV